MAKHSKMYPKRLGDLHPWRLHELDWTSPWATSWEFKTALVLNRRLNHMTSRGSFQTMTLKTWVLSLKKPWCCHESFLGWCLDSLTQVSALAHASLMTSFQLHNLTISLTDSHHPKLVWSFPHCLLSLTASFNWYYLVHGSWFSTLSLPCQFLYLFCVKLNKLLLIWNIWCSRWDANLSEPSLLISWLWYILYTPGRGTSRGKNEAWTALCRMASNL